MAITFTNTSQASVNNGIKALVYGKAGHGKTTLCRTAPRPFIISAESGLLCLVGSNIPVAEIDTIDDLRSMYLWATQSPEVNNFDTICLDSLTEMAEKLLNSAKKKVKDPRQAYGQLIEEMTDLIRAFRDIKGKHIYFSAKQEWTKDDVTGITSYGPAMPGNKLGQQLPYFFDEVFCLNIGKGAPTLAHPLGEPFRYLQTAPDFQYSAKDRSGRLDAMEPPDITHVFNKMLQPLEASPASLAPTQATA
jgi:phage nucleotide-binding protein